MQIENRMCNLHFSLHHVVPFQQLIFSRVIALLRLSLILSWLVQITLHFSSEYKKKWKFPKILSTKWFSENSRLVRLPVNFRYTFYRKFLRIQSYWINSPKRFFYKALFVFQFVGRCLAWLTFNQAIRYGRRHKALLWSERCNLCKFPTRQYIFKNDLLIPLVLIRLS